MVPAPSAQTPTVAHAGGPARGTVIAGGAGKNHVVIGNMETGIPHFLTIDQPTVHAVALARLGARFHPCCIRAVVGFGQAKTPYPFAAGQFGQIFFLLLLRAEFLQHRREHRQAKRHNARRISGGGFFFGGDGCAVVVGIGGGGGFFRGMGGGGGVWRAALSCDVASGIRRIGSSSRSGSSGSSSGGSSGST